MKRILSIWLLCITLIQGTGQCWIVASFYLNRSYIAENLCVNRFDLIPVCRGICFLEQQMTEHEKQQDRMPDVKYREIMLFCQHETCTVSGTPVAEHDIVFNNYQSPYKPYMPVQHIFKPPARLS
ncbi:MAG TPA: hypothetical protein VM802_03765 [Chitinophaga sp.]|uniref:hypothetical protein n=1 Tax=Chitinophaga sp. TaxID=1869181 RepID=UPI002C5C021D|nr:hypothetical protein [Chitinophaga sp.]HVI43952.1 hypothetical protein [Chitinophaga sp.]